VREKLWEQTIEGQVALGSSWEVLWECSLTTGSEVDRLWVSFEGGS
jgi:hypothetical protein